MAPSSSNVAAQKAKVKSKIIGQSFQVTIVFLQLGIDSFHLRTMVKMRTTKLGNNNSHEISRLVQSYVSHHMVVWKQTSFIGIKCQPLFAPIPLPAVSPVL